MRSRALTVLIALLAACEPQVADLPGAVPSAMPTTLTPASPPTIPTSLSAPADGDACNAASNNGPDQSMLNAIDAYRQMFLGQGLAMKPMLRSMDGTTVVMSACPAMMVTTGGVWTVKGPIAAQTFAVADLEGGGAFANNTVYYCYLYLSAGAVTKQISTTAPDSYRRYKTGGTDYAYVGSFTVINSGRIVSFTRVGNIYHYANPQSGVAMAGASGTLDLTTATTFPGIPATGRIGIFALVNGAGTHDDSSAQFDIYPADFTSADTGQYTRTLNQRVTDGNGTASSSLLNQGAEFYVGINGSKQVKFAASNTNYNASLWAMGYVEE